jgi:hypothetical protein
MRARLAATRFVVKLAFAIGVFVSVAAGGAWAQPQSFESVNYPGRFIRHAFSLGELQPLSTPLDGADAAWVLVPGLAGGNSVSFESVNYPGHYLRHQDYRLKLHGSDGSALFRQDASFIVRPGLAGSGQSFESVNFPGHFIRHSNFNLWLAANDGSRLFQEDASFRPQPAAQALANNVVSGMLQQLFDANRGDLENLLRQYLGRGDMIARGVTLYEINPRLGTSQFQVTGGGGFRYAVNGNYMYFKSTQPSAAGSYADPAFEMHFDLLVTGIVVGPAGVGQRPHVEAVVASVPSLTVKSRNVVGGVVLSVVKFFMQMPWGRELIQQAADQMLRRDITDQINAQLAGI